MDKILAKKDFPQWLKKLRAYRLFAPRLIEEVWNYEVVDDPDHYVLPDVQTVVPVKKVVFPARECFFEFEETDGTTLTLTERRPDAPATVVFGVRPCEGKALTLTDSVFGGTFDDPYYGERRKATAIVGLACNTPPSSDCFCLSVGGAPHSTEGLDILLTDLGETYYAQALTETGKKLINEGGALFSEPKAEDRKTVERLRPESERRLTRRLENIKNVPAKLKGMFDAPLWDEESLSCLRCGICTYLCPTCHCFDMNDEVESTVPLRGKKVRTWDTCQFPDFTMHSSGHNPRPDKAARLRQRINHKFQYFVEIWKDYQCTGCGRCIALCPVGIDIIKVVEKVRDYGS